MTFRTLEDITADFSYLEDWEDRYRYVMELGKELPDLEEQTRTDENKVQGCASQVWLVTKVQNDTQQTSPTLEFQGDSDSALVRGLIAILLSAYSGKTAPDILKIEATQILSELGLEDHITPQRSNGFAAMARRINIDAQHALQNS